MTHLASVEDNKGSAVELTIVCNSVVILSYNMWISFQT